MEEEEDIPPFWLQPADGRRSRRLRRQASSIFLNSGVFLLFLLVIAFVFVFIIVPSFVSFTSQIFKPNSIKKSWDSLNLVLVLFAIVCGFLGRNHNNDNNNGSPTYQSISSSNVQQNEAQRSYPSTPVNRWYQDRTPYNSLNRLRSFNSYPDLRQESLWMTNDERWRFYDDTHLNSYRINSNPDQLQDVPPPPPPQKPQEVKKLVKDDVSSKDVDVETSVKKVVYTPPPPPAESPPPQPHSPPKPPGKAVRRKIKRTYEDLGYEKRKVEKDFEVRNLNAPPLSPPHQPPPVTQKNEKKRGKDLFTPFRKKKKKQRQKSVENLESLFDPQSSFYQSSIPPPSPAPPPPPPPPPPPHFFQNLFSSKKSRAKKAHSAPPPPPPPPPRPATSSARTARVSESRASRTTVQEAAVETHKPPKSVRTGGFSGAEVIVESGNLSPLNPIPPPPPLPPFKMSSWKFVRDGDYVRVASFNSSRSGSPDLEGEEPSDKESSPMASSKDGNGESTLMPSFCPSPDVNTKAEDFIARFRAGLKMEKMNSVKGRSKLGPGSDTVEGEGPT